MAYTTIDDPSAYFQTVLWTGDGAADTRTISFDGNSNMQPDWVWHKQRDDIYGNHVFDSSRGFGANKELVTRGSFVEGDTSNFNTGANGYVNAAASNGFVVKKGTGGVGNVYINQSGDTHVAWCWKANGGTTASNTDGSITSTVQANTDAGFSIVTYTGTGSNATVGHGLGAVPDMVIVKGRSSTENWGVQLANALGNTNALRLNLTDSYGGSDGALWWNDTSPTSTTVSIGTRSEVNTNTSTYIMYCFKNIQGYSRIGKYIGVGGDNGTFVYTGFKPSWVMIRRTNAVGAWEIYDLKRGGGNPMGSTDLQADSNGAENASTIGNGIDILSNGFKPRTGTLYLNGAGSTYIYLAFAERPFVSSNGVPTVAR